MAVRTLLHYALEVPDLSVGERFYQNFGLSDRPARDEAVHLCPAQLPRESVRLYPGPKKRLQHVAFGAPRDDFAQVQEAIRRAGVREVDPPAGGTDGGLWIHDPDGNLINIRDEGPLTLPADPPPALNSPAHPARQAVRGCPEADLIAQPRRLGHVLLFTPDVGRRLAFYTQVLGLKLSDRCQHIIAFLRCSTDHHNVAFLSSTGPGFHHGSFEVGGVDEIAMGALRMRESGWEPGWGLGRHVIGSNYFYSIRDPWGSFAEDFFDLDYIPESCAWEPRDFPAQDALYRWGTEPPPDFGENKELA
jgi:catechol 2,3-dioxygenase-like lactoylglutathione lyase family enzyme